MSLLWYGALILLTGAERIVELVISKRNAAWAFHRDGGLVVGSGGPVPTWTIAAR